MMNFELFELREREKELTAQAIYQLRAFNNPDCSPESRHYWESIYWETKGLLENVAKRIPG